MSDIIPWKPLFPFGAELDVDLGKELTPAQATALQQLFRQHYLLVARGQTLNEEQQLRVMSYLGPVPPDGAAIASNDPTVGLQGSIRLAFHSDLAFAPEPDLGASLYAMDLTNDTSSTSFASGVRAYQKLPAALQQRLQGLESLSIWALDQTRRNRAATLSSTDPRCAHPVVWNHPATGKPILYVTEMQGDCILGLPEQESEALIEELFGYLYAEDNIVNHRWRVGDIAIWDNLALQHARNDVSQVGIRTLRRVSLARQTFLAQFPQFQAGSSGFMDERMNEFSES